MVWQGYITEEETGVWTLREAYLLWIGLVSSMDDSGLVALTASLLFVGSLAQTSNATADHEDPQLTMQMLPTSIL